MAIGYKKKNHIYKIKPFGRIKKEAYAARKTKNHLLHVAKKMWTVVVSLPGRNPRFGHRPLAACPWSRSGWKFREKNASLNLIQTKNAKMFSENNTAKKWIPRRNLMI